MAAVAWGAPHSQGLIWKAHPPSLCVVHSFLSQTNVEGTSLYWPWPWPHSHRGPLRTVPVLPGPSFSEPHDVRLMILIPLVRHCSDQRW